MERSTAKEVILKHKCNGTDVSGETNCDNMMICPGCDSVVGDYEWNELYFNYCPQCGQKLKYTKK